MEYGMIRYAVYLLGSMRETFTVRDIHSLVAQIKPIERRDVKKTIKRLVERGVVQLVGRDREGRNIYRYRLRKAYPHRLGVEQFRMGMMHSYDGLGRTTETSSVVRRYGYASVRRPILSGNQRYFWINVSPSYLPPPLITDPMRERKILYVSLSSVHGGRVRSDTYYYVFSPSTYIPQRFQYQIRIPHEIVARHLGGEPMGDVYVQINVAPPDPDLTNPYVAVMTRVARPRPEILRAPFPASYVMRLADMRREAGIETREVEWRVYSIDKGRLISEGVVDWGTLTSQSKHFIYFNMGTARQDERIYILTHLI